MMVELILLVDTMLEQRAEREEVLSGSPRSKVMLRRIWSLMGGFGNWIGFVNDAADDADFGRRRVDHVLIDARRNLDCRLWGVGIL